MARDYTRSVRLVIGIVKRKYRTWLSRGPRSLRVLCDAYGSSLSQNPTGDDAWNPTFRKARKVGHPALDSNGTVKWSLSFRKAKGGIPGDSANYDDDKSSRIKALI
jgi:hypothetical protein